MRVIVIGSWAVSTPLIQYFSGAKAYCQGISRHWEAVTIPINFILSASNSDKTLPVVAKTFLVISSRSGKLNKKWEQKKLLFWREASKCALLTTPTFSLFPAPKLGRQDALVRGRSSKSAHGILSLPAWSQKCAFHFTGSHARVFSLGKDSVRTLSKPCAIYS